MKPENTPPQTIDTIFDAQKDFFRSGQTLSVDFRRQMLEKLKSALRKWEKPICDALWQDLHKSYQEAYITELSIVTSEINYHLTHIGTWTKPDKYPTSAALFPSRSRTYHQPLGCTLVIAPWNYPVQLLLNPLVGAISAGCTALLKPSPYVPHVAAVIQSLIRDTFNENYIAVILGNRDTNEILLRKRFDLIFFTGSPALGKIVMQAAAEHLTPVILELGGKNPCIVDHHANLTIAAKRIAWGKCMNAGQTCIAPDYLLVHEKIKKPFVEALKTAFQNLLGEDPQQSPFFGRMVNDNAFQRVVGYLQDGEILFGGKFNSEERYIEPAVIHVTDLHVSAMQEEIFGPICPLITFNEIQHIIPFMNQREKPLAMYYFGDEKTAQTLLRNTSSGGFCMNDTLIHIANHHLPFGGVGHSGIGAYHGKFSFEAFSHLRAVVSTPVWIDLPFRYMPYKWFKLIKRLL